MCATQAQQEIGIGITFRHRQLTSSTFEQWLHLIGGCGWSRTGVQLMDYEES